MLVGYALAGEPELEARLRDGTVRWAAARAIGRIHQNPDFLWPGDDWLEKASTLNLKDLRRHVRERIESVRQEADARVSFTASITEQAREELERCRAVALKKAKQRLTNGQLIRALATTYLDLFDPLAREPRKRRMPDTATRPTSRGVPAEVVRAILARSGGLCEVGTCERVGEELCHLTPHREGSGREVRDLVNSCHQHHAHLDADRLRFVGWTDDGGPTFLVPKTGEFLPPKPPAETREAPPRPRWLIEATRRPSRQAARQAPQPRQPPPPDVSGGSGGAGRVGEALLPYGISGAPPPGCGAGISQSVRRRPDARAPRAGAPSSRPRSRRNPSPTG